MVTRIFREVAFVVLVSLTVGAFCATALVLTALFLWSSDPSLWYD